VVEAVVVEGLTARAAMGTKRLENQMFVEGIIRSWTRTWIAESWYTTAGLWSEKRMRKDTKIIACPGESIVRTKSGKA